jgi:hypothetical protein
MEYIDTCPKNPKFENCHFCDLNEICITPIPESQKLINLIKFELQMDLDSDSLDNLF